MTLQMHIIIDGYNLIRQSHRIRPVEKFGLEAGRNRLIEELARYNRLNNHHITVVFDGWRDGSPHEEHHRKGGIDIVYSRRGEEADEVIKRMTLKTGQEILVVTSDHDIARAVVKAGGVVLSSPEFEQKYTEGITAAPVLEDFSHEEEEDPSVPAVAGRKKGPARKLSKRAKKTRKALAKL